ncbi:MAG: SpaA isopeptide-forming pilin-related protein [Chloroflexota bacterium]
MRSIARRSRSLAPALLHLLALAALAASLLAPLVPGAPAGAQRARDREPVPVPQRVTATGTFQALLGCAYDGDPACAQTELRQTGSNIFAAFLPIPPGDYSLRVALDGGERYSLGENGAPDGQDILLRVPDGSAGAYVAYDANTGRVTAEPAPANVELVTDLGQRVPMEPGRRGGYSARWDATAGVYGVQILVNGEPVAQDSVSLDRDSRVVFDVDDSGQVARKDLLPSGALAISRSDDTGQPLPGACFAVYDGNDLLGQACDADDGADDGRILIRFPNGVDQIPAELRETRAPGGGQPAEPRRIDLAPGDQTASVSTPAGAAAPGEQPGEPPAPGEQPPTDQPQPPPAAGQLAVAIVNARGNPLPGACVEIVEFGFQACDDQGDGRITFDGLQPGLYTIREITAPEGRDLLPDQQVELRPEGALVTFTHGRGQQEPEGGEPPAPASGGAGGVELVALGPDGAPAPGGCYALVSSADGARREQCDDADGIPDAYLLFSDVPEGSWSVEEMSPPAGMLPAQPVSIDVRAGETSRATISSAREPEPAQTGTGALRVDTVDEAGTPLPGACYDLAGPASLGGLCDPDGGGRFLVSDLPPGDYVLRQTAAPDGYPAAPEQPVTILPGETARVSVVNALAAPQPATEEPAGDAGAVIIRAFDGAGAVAPGGCYYLAGPVVYELCDNDATDGNPEGGRLRIANLPPGSYYFVETAAPPASGFSEGDLTFDLAAGQTAQVQVEPGRPPMLIQDGDLMPTPDPARQRGGVEVAVSGPDGQPVAGACLRLDGPTPANRLCDDSDGDGDARPGVIRYEGMDPGDYTLEILPPEGYEAPAPQALTVAPGQILAVQAALAPAAAEPGALEIVALDPDGLPVGGACFQIAGPAAGPICDDAESDSDPTPGRVIAAGLPAGQYGVGVSRSPAGYAQNDERFTVDVAPGQQARAAFTFQPQRLSGSLLVTVAVEEGLDPAFCVESLNGSLPGTPVCDNAGGDLDPGPGRVLIDGIAPGTYGVIAVSDDPEAENPSGQDVTIAAGETAQAAFDIRRRAPETGDITVVTQRPDGVPAGAACYDLVGPDGGVAASLCDDDGDGGIRFAATPPGDWIVRQTAPPAGSLPSQPAEQPVSVRPGEESRLVFTSAAGFGTARVTLADETGAPVPFCAELRPVGGGAPAGPACDQAEADREQAAGAVAIADVPAGQYTVVLSGLPEGYPVPAEQPLVVIENQAAGVDLRLTRPNGQAVLTIQDPDGALLPGTCLTIAGPDGFESNEFCDQGDDGILTFPDTPPGPWIFRITRVAEGFEVPPPVSVEVPAGRSIDVPVTLERTAPTVTPTPEATATVTPGPAVETATVAPTATGAATAASGGVAPAEPTRAPTATPEPAPPGSLAHSARNPDGAPVALAGFCYDLTGPVALARVCDNGPDDGNLAPGTVRIDGLPAGSWTASQVSAPQGYQLAGSVRARVEPGQLAEAAFTNQPVPPAVGSLLISARDPGDAPLGGACYRVLDAAGAEVAAVCDNDRADTGNRNGLTGIAGLDAGPVTVEQTRAPEGYDLAPPQGLTVAGDVETPLVFVNPPLAPETGSVTLRAFDESGEPAAGECYLLTSPGEQRGPVCDNGAGDADGAPGALVIDDLPVGSWEAIPQGVAGDAATRAAQARDWTQKRAFTLRRGGRPVEVRVNVRRQRPTTGDLLVATRDERNQALGGACYELDGRNEVCDNGRGDGDARLGQVAISDIPEGDYTLSQSRAPRGYEAAPDRSVSIRGGAERSVSFSNQPVRDRNGEVVVRTVDRNGDRIPGACYRLVTGTVTIGPRCDADDRAEGSTVFENVVPGAYLVRMTRAPEGYSSGNDTAVRVLAGETAEASVTVARKPGSLLIRKLDPRGIALGGACFQIFDDGGAGGYDLCDNDPSDANRADGLILLQGVAPGDYTIRETRAPGGYQLAGDITATVQPGARASAQVTNQPLPPPAQVGSLTVTKTDAANQLLPGACFSLSSGDVTLAGPICDGDDGARDGIIRFTGVGVGEYLLRETLAPSAIWQPAADQRVIVEENRTTRTVVANTLREGRVLVRKTDPAGEPLAGACFVLEPRRETVSCTDASGRAWFTVPAGAYRLVESSAPAGYLAAAPIPGVVVNPAATTLLDVVNQPVPPPPDTGALQVVKFVCPAGEQGEFTFMFDSSNPGASKLGQTAGCTPGDARFRMDDYQGAYAPWEFTTGGDGRYQVTLPQGTYLLAELAPDLPGEAAEEVAIAAGQLTTVVVLNFVAPPEPAPGSVEIVKYTCAPGLRGVTFEDFVNACAESRALTNNVPFLLSGAVNSRRVTGDVGEQGVTRFYNLPAGPYRLRELAAADAAQSVFSFCGADPNAPDRAGIGTTMDVAVGNGQAIVCYVFDVPDPVTETTGVIVVHKLSCPVASPPPGYDWRAACAPQGAGVRFALSFFDGQRFIPRATGATGADSTLQFIDAPPGLYQLTEVGAKWCRAESDNVDARGNVIVEAGKRSSVWIFNCTGARTPPNTGAGPGGGAGRTPVDAAAGLPPAIPGTTVVSLAAPATAPPGDGAVAAAAPLVGGVTPGQQNVPYTFRQQ